MICCRQTTGHYLNEHYLTIICDSVKMGVDWIDGEGFCAYTRNDLINAESIIGTGNSWRYQAITQTNVNLSLNVFCGFHLRAIPQALLKLIRDMCSEMVWSEHDSRSERLYLNWLLLINDISLMKLQKLTFYFLVGIACHATCFQA